MTKTSTALTTAEVAKKLNTDGRTLRRYLRSTKQGVGTGKRYEFTSGDIADLKKGFTAWRKEVEGEKAAVVHTCDQCDKSFKSASGLASHSRVHEDPDPDGNLAEAAVADADA